MTLGEIKRILRSTPIPLTRSLGQNFLHDGNQLRRIVAAAELSPSNRVLEIGPGLGPLTELLISEAGHVWALEKDLRLHRLLAERFAGAPNLVLRHVDALEWLKENPRDWTGWKIVANLPFSVASPLLVQFALSPQPPERLVVTLQWEVLQRLLAAAGQPDYGLLTLLLQMRFLPAAFFKIPASCFYPPPRVDSGCVTLQLRTPPLVAADLIPLFVRIVRRAFSQRRKTALKLLRGDWPEDRLTALFGQMGLHPQVRAEEISLPEFVRLAEMLASP
ncbi:MAG: ribosomal RNA small subunit methyltransferase A [Verrucomicrobia bacterium]|nr:ribosomal RNA small subunit methyltransferase A [Verrucomicrobiota bacterium]